MVGAAAEVLCAINAEFRKCAWRFPQWGSFGLRRSRRSIRQAGRQQRITAERSIAFLRVRHNRRTPDPLNDRIARLLACRQDGQRQRRDQEGDRNHPGEFAERSGRLSSGHDAATAADPEATALRALHENDADQHQSQNQVYGQCNVAHRRDSLIGSLHQVGNAAITCKQRDLQH